MYGCSSVSASPNAAGRERDRATIPTQMNLGTQENAKKDEVLSLVLLEFYVENPRV
jgi:hypothetical protein